MALSIVGFNLGIELMQLFFTAVSGLVESDAGLLLRQNHLIRVGADCSLGWASCLSGQANFIDRRASTRITFLQRLCSHSVLVTQRKSDFSRLLKVFLTPEKVNRNA